MNSPAYQQDGLLLILFDEAEFSITSGDASACCNALPGPNSPLPGITGPGGGRVGAMVLSKFVRAGTWLRLPTTTTRYWEPSTSSASIILDSRDSLGSV